MSIASTTAVGRMMGEEGISLIRQISDHPGLHMMVLPAGGLEDSSQTSEAEPRRFGSLYIDYGRQHVEMAGKVINLSPTEYRLLLALVRHAGKVVGCEQLRREMFDGEKTQSKHYVRMYVRLLRKRIEAKPESPRIILTVRRQGYRLAVPAATESVNRNANSLP